MPPILDVAIGTVFVFLLFSLVVSALNEYLLSLFDERAKFLRLGLAEMFGKAAVQPKSNYLRLSTEGEALLSHGLINAFSRSDSGGTSPSYLPAGAFVTALLDMAAGQGTPVTNGTAQIATANTFLAKLQAARPLVGASISGPDLDKLLSDFIADYARLKPTPAPETPLDQLKIRAVEAQTRAQAQADLIALSTAATVAQINNAIAAVATPSIRGELEKRLEKVGGDLKSFLQSISSWFSPDDIRAEFEVAAGSAMVRLLHNTAEHTALAIEAGLKRFSISNPKLGESLLSLYRSVDGDVQKFKLAVEGWFNSVMDRVSGWYKRFAQKWMIAFGFILAAIFNVDTVEIVRVLSNNPNLAKAVADQAGTYVQRNGRPMSASELGEEREAKLQAVQAAEKTLEDARKATGIDETKLKELAGKVAAAHADADSLSAYQEAVKKLFSTGLPIGWSPEVKSRLGIPVKGEATALRDNSPADSAKVDFRIDVLLAMIGSWFITAIAASLGAPFWFDILGRFVNIRNAGRPPGEKDATSTATKPQPATLDKPPAK